MALLQTWILLVMEEKTYYFFPNKIKERQLETPGETTIKKNKILLQVWRRAKTVYIRHLLGFKKKKELFYWH